MILIANMHGPNQTQTVWLEGIEFYRRTMKSWFHDNNIEMCSTHNKRKSVTAERTKK